MFVCILVKLTVWHDLCYGHYCRIFLRVALSFEKRPSDFRSDGHFREKKPTMSFTRTLAQAAFAAALALAACHPAAAQYATLSLQSQPGDFIGAGKNYDLIYLPSSPGNTISAQVLRTEPSGLPSEALFVLNQSVTLDNFASLSFSTIQLGVPLQPGEYTDAQRAAFAATGHAGLDVTFLHRGSNTLTGKFKITDFTYTKMSSGTLVINTFDASFEQHSEGFAPALFGQFSYRDTGAPPVPEASSIVSLGLLLSLGMGGVIIARRRRTA